jgi:methylated-DNA-[protein]-cysteine S-methyltransferase
MMLYYNVIHSPFGDIGLLWKWKSDVPSVARILLPRGSGGLEDFGRAQGLDLLRKSVPAIEQISAKISLYLEGKTVAFSLSLVDLDSCYEFQKKVLLADAGIPRGRVSSYGALALRVGSPRAARAVGTALARNPFPIIIPCHRTVRSDGCLGGFAGGWEMKRTLLEMEGVSFDSKGRVEEKFFF